MTKKYTLANAPGFVNEIVLSTADKYIPQSSMVYNNGTDTRIAVGGCTATGWYVWERTTTVSTWTHNVFWEDSGYTPTQMPLLFYSAERGGPMLFLVSDNGLRVYISNTTNYKYYNNPFGSEIAGLAITAANIRLIGVHNLESTNKIYIHYLVIGASSTTYYIKKVATADSSWTNVISFPTYHSSFAYPPAAFGYVSEDGAYFGRFMNDATTLYEVQILPSGSANTLTYAALSGYELYRPQYIPYGPIHCYKITATGAMVTLTDNGLALDMNILACADWNSIQRQSALGYEYSVCWVKIADTTYYSALIDGYTQNVYLISTVQPGGNPAGITANYYVESDTNYPAWTLSKTTFACIKGVKTEGAFEMSMKTDGLNYFNGQTIFLFSGYDTLICRYWIESIIRTGPLLKFKGHNLNNEINEGYPYFCNIPGTVGTWLRDGIQTSTNNLYTLDGDLIITGDTRYIDGSDLSIAELIANSELYYSTKISVTPAGRIQQLATPTSTGITLSTANKNCTFRNEFTFISEYGVVMLDGGFTEGTRIYAIERNSSLDMSIVYYALLPWITDQDQLDLLAANILANQQAQISQFTPIYKGDVLQTGNSITVDITNLVDMFPTLGASSSTMYIDSMSYDLPSGIQKLVLVTGWIFRRTQPEGNNLIAQSISNLIAQSISNLAKDAQENGNIYLPYFQATNYNTATSAWVSQSCADNTVTPLNLYNIVQNEGGWTWSSSNRTKVYVPTAGWYLFQARVQFAGNTSGTRQARLRIDGVNADSHMLSAFLTQGSIDTIVNATGMGYVDEGSYVELCGLQDTNPGVSLDMKYMAFNIVRLSR